MDLNHAYLGTELKYALNISAEGFSMAEDNFRVELKCGPRSIVLEKDDLTRDGEDNYYITFDSREIGPGRITAIITAYVPDEDFEDGLRTEIAKVDLAYIKSI